MAHTYTVLGDWMLKNKRHFKSDQTKSCKLLVLVDGVPFVELLQIVKEEYELDFSFHDI